MQIAAKMIYGTAWKKEQTAALVINAVLNGFRAIDTAGQPRHYREDLVGDALEILYKKHGFQREQIFLQTKYTPIKGQDVKQPLPYNPSDPIGEQIQTSFYKSLANLKTNYIDSYLLHSPFKTLEQTLEAWRVLARLQDEGKVGLIGICNAYDINMLHALSRERKVQVVQNRWYEDNEWDRLVLNYCGVNGVMYESFWTLSGSPSLLSNPSLLAFAKTTGMTPEQAVFKFAQLQGIVPLSGTTSTPHMQQDIAVDSVELPLGSDDTITEIRKFVWG